MKKSFLVCILSFLFLFTVNTFAGEVTVLGSQKYLRTSGSPDNYSDDFIAVTGQGSIVVKNGSYDGSNRIIDSVSSANVWFNGVLVFGPSSFNKNVYLLEGTVDLQENNTITVELTSSPDSYITVDIIEDIDPPTVSLSTSSTSIPLGGSSTLSWDSALATSCAIEPDIGAVDLNGSTTVTPDVTTTYTITATGLGGTSSATTTIEVVPPPTVTIQADLQSIIGGESTVLTWSSTDAGSCTIEPDIGTVEPNGSIAVSPAATTTYTVTASGVYESATDNVQVVVYDPPTASINVTPLEINSGDSAVLSWEATNAETCTITPDIGTVAVSGSITVAPSETVIYTILAQGPGGAATSTATLKVIEVNASPEVTFNEPSIFIEKGSSVDIGWTSQGAETVHIDNIIGSVTLDGFHTVSPETTTTYTITAVSSFGISSDKMTVYVTGAPAPLPEGSFGKTYEDLIPVDATVDEYDSNRFALITGIVNDINGNPLQDVEVTVYTHQEYGTAVSDIDGRFSLPVEGGGTLTLQFAKEGFITSHRQVLTPWNDIAICETVHLITQDDKSTAVTFDGSPDTIIVHDSTPVSDEFGNRSATLVFSGDNRAFITDAQGNDIRELTTVTVRATEFETPETMPAKLPPNSAYTYCTELQVDGADRVRFEKPVPLWVDNFLGFDVGEIVPVGYYDRDRAVWVPSDNGVVVRLLDTDNDGSVDALDATGDGLADDLNNNASFTDEVAGLDDPMRYPPNTTFWRSEIQHFTPWDCNWPYGPPTDAIPPNPEGVPLADMQTEEQKDCKTLTGSFVEERSRVFHDDIPIPGTDLTLHYASNRVKGYKHHISVPASGDSVPDSLKNIIVRLNIAGRQFERILEPLPNQNADFLWDGLDQLGRPVGAIKGLVRIGFKYDLIYYGAASELNQAFAQTGNNITAIRGREDMISWKNWELSLGELNQNNQNLDGIADGWSFSLHHSILPNDFSTLYKGNGSKINFNSSFVKTIAGNGSPGFNGDYIAATESSLYYPYDVATDANGNVFIADYFNRRIRKVDIDNNITTIAGNGIFDYSGDGGPAIDSSLTFPKAVEVDFLGNIYIGSDMRVRKVDLTGVITTILGGEISGYWGDGGMAVEAGIKTCSGIAADNYGNVFVVDSSDNRIRKIDASGIITTVAGNGTAGYNGDNILAINAMLNTPQSIAVDNVGNLFIADYGNNRIRKIDQSGIITTVAGNGASGANSVLISDIPAIDVALIEVDGVAVDNLGNIYFTEKGRWSYGPRVIRKIDKNGLLKTIAGNIAKGFKDGISTKSILDNPLKVSVDNIGNVYFNELTIHRVRKIEIPSIYKQKMANGSIPFSERSGLGFIISGTGLHKSTIDLETGASLKKFSYNENNQLIIITDQFGNQTIINRDVNGVPISITSPDGIVTQLAIDDNNHLTNITYPDGGYYTFEYSLDGLMTAKMEPEGNRFDHIFSSSGRLINSTDDNGGNWQFNKVSMEDGSVLSEVLTSEGDLTSYLDVTDSTGAYISTITDTTGGQSEFYESSDGLLATKSLSCGMNLEFKYDLDSEYNFKFVKQMTESTPGNLNRITVRDKTYSDTDSNEIPDLITQTVSVNGKQTSLVNNVLLSQETITSPEGRTSTIHYNPDTLVTESVSVPGLYDTTFGYNLQGRLISIDTQNRGMAFTYNSQGFLETSTDAENYTTEYLYDPVGRVKQINRSDTTSLWFDYDANGNMTLLTNPSTVNHAFTFNKVNLESGYTTPLSGSYSYTYDKDRRLTQKLFPSGESINFIYNSGRLSQVQTPEGDIDYTYFCSSKIDTITRGLESVSYTWDGKLVTSESFAGNLSQTINYDYNNDFNLSNMTYAGAATGFTYDNDGLLIGSGNFTITRNLQNGLPESVSGGGLNISRTFNGFGETETQTQTVNTQSLMAWDLTRDNNGRVTNKAQTVNGTASSYDYTYDAMGRILTVTKDNTLVEEYQYGANGSRIYEMNAERGISGRTLDYSDEDHLLSAGDVYYSYNLDGFLSTRTEGSDVTVYDYPSRGELLSVDLPDGTLVEYLHDPIGRRIAKKVNGTVTEKYLWQGLTTLLAVYDGSDNLLQRFEYADGRMPVTMTAGGATYYLMYDQVGSLILVGDASGNVVKQIEYDTFGNIISDSNPAFTVPFGFAGGLVDHHTDLVRFGHRDYDPETGRWTVKDPIFFSGGDTDLYGYVLNDPVNLIDPTGEFAHILGGFVGGAIGGSVMGAISGGIVAAATGQSIWQGAAKGALSGAVIGGVTGGLLMAGVPYIPVASQAFSEGLLYGLWGTKLPSAFSIGFNILKAPGIAEGSTLSPCP